MRRVSSAFLLALLLAACAKAGPGAGGDQPPEPVGPRTNNQLILRVDACCGYVPVEYALRAMPFFSLMGDGRILTLGPQMEIYPQPALPNVQEQPVDDAGIQAILEAARHAGLGESHDYAGPVSISDASTTIFTLVDVDGTKHVTRAYALTESTDDGLPAKDREARHKLRRFWERLGNLHAWLPEGSLGRESEYAPTALRVFARRYTDADVDPSVKQEPMAWPLAARPLDTFGDPVEGQGGLRCGVVDGADLDLLLPEAKRSNELTPWVSDGTRYRLFFRPLLPDEQGC